MAAKWILLAFFSLSWVFLDLFDWICVIELNRKDFVKGFDEI